jgi:translocation and assembly module TamB
MLASSALTALLAGLAGVVALPVAVVATVYATLNSEAGTAWLLPRLPGVDVRAPQGALLGPVFAAERLRVSTSGGSGEVVIEGLRWEGAQWRWWVGAHVWAGVRLQSLQAREVRVRSAPAQGATPVPASLALPLALEVGSLAVETLRVDSLQPVRGLRASVQLQTPATGAAARHRLDGLSFEWDQLQVREGQASVRVQPPFQIEAALQATGTGTTPWQARAEANGPLTDFRLRGWLRGLSAGGRELAAGDLTAQVRPFAAWPLGELELQTRALDLSALLSRAPQTKLSGRATLRPRAAGQPLQVSLDFDNRLPGRLDERRLPVQRLQAALQTPSTDIEQLQATGFEVVFASAAGEAGRWRGSGLWRDGSLNLDTQLAGLRPQELDRRAPAMRVSGPLQLVAGGTWLARSSSRAPRAGPTLGFRGELQGALDVRPQPVSLAFEGQASPRELVLTRLRAASGAASADFSATLQPGPGTRWQARSEGRLDSFDPLLWFPGREGSTWRRGPHRLNASWKLELGGPAAAWQGAPLQLLQSLQGEGQLELRDSLLAGVPVGARLSFAQELAAGVQPRSRFQVRVQLARNVLAVNGAGDPAGSGEADRLEAEVDAPELAALAPLASLHPALARWTPQAGSAQGRLAAQGRWPALRTEGRLRASDLRAAELSLARGTLDWQMDAAGDAPLALQTEVLQVRIGALRAAVLRADVRGTQRAHTLSLEVAAPLQPPPLLARTLGLQQAAGTQALLRGSGSWDGVPAGGGTWRGTLERLSAGVWDGSTERRAAAADASWLDARELRGELRLGRDWEPVWLQAQPGQAMLAGGVPLRWDEVRWRAHAGHPDLALRAEVAPVLVAPFLQRMRTGFRWSGDLRMGARLDVRAGERFSADIALFRQEGDLQVLESGSTPQPLGISQAEFALVARDGLWRFTPLLTGTQVGRVFGAVTVRAAAQDRLPAHDAPMEGALNLLVPQLGVWASWLPPGWRIAGELSSTARLGGTLAAPQVTGELRAGGVAVRNLLQGVAFSDGELFVTLEGETARIQRLSLRGGEGTLSAEGTATIGPSPTAELRARASRFRVIGRVDRQLVASGEGRLTLQPDRLRASGRLAVDSGLFDLSRRDAPALDEDVTVRRADEAAQALPVPAPLPALMRNAQVALDIDLGEQLRLRGYGIDTGLRGQLRVSTPGGRLAVQGAVRTVDGTYAGYGQKLEIERGVLTLAGPLDTARLDVLALRPKIDTRVGVAITGPLQGLRAKLYSEPEMAETEKLSWLLLGRPTEGLGRADTAVLQRAATALLAGQGDAPTDVILRTFGLDDLSFRQTEGDTRDTIITLGKQLGRRWYVGYERGVNATAGTFQLIYRIAQRFTLRAQGGLENSLDLIWVWRFDEPLTPRPRGP